MTKIPSKIDRLVGNLDKEVWQAQEKILEQGKQIICRWLQNAEDEGGFYQAVDWLLGNSADRYFNDYREVLAVEMIRNTVQLFEIRDNSSEDVYKDARHWFRVS